jgi:hypothetical protein
LRQYRAKNPQPEGGQDQQAGDDGKTITFRNENREECRHVQQDCDGDPTAVGTACLMIWPGRFELGHFLRMCALRVGRIEVPVPFQAQVKEFEKLEFIRLEGWRPAP